MNDIFAYMLGPKAENLALFRTLIVDALDDHMFWRRNFYPEDKPLITAIRQSDEQYREFVDRLRDCLFEFLSDAKKGVPYFSSRYVGHMNTDLLLPALVGYFGAMLYNNNNVADESSPVTARLELETINMLLEMVGMERGAGWGYLTSGGTAANIYGLWAARNARTLPLSFRLMLSEKVTPPLDYLMRLYKAKGLSFGSADDLRERVETVRRALRTTELRDAQDIQHCITHMTGWQLANISLTQACSLRRDAVVRIQNVIQCAPGSDEPGILFDTLLSSTELKTIGIRQFCALAAKEFSDVSWLEFGCWRVYLPRNAHYSWPKALDVLGLGHDAIAKVPHRSSFDLNVDELRKAILDDISPNGSPRAWPLMICSTFGTTEEGALDDLPAINAILSDLQKEHGVTLWHHVDACYGGYLASMIRRNDGSVCNADELKQWLAECGGAVGLETDETTKLIEMSETTSARWLSWQQFIDRTAALSTADSISIDPHKLGYVPYPAGAVLLKNRRAREVLSSDAPYLWVGPQNESGFTGRYTLEGSRPGATVAACWLAHKTVPLNQHGHGRLVALSILGARKLYDGLSTGLAAPDSGARVAVVHQPHSNMICYVPYHTDFESLSETDEITARVLERLHPTNENRPFMAVGTELALATGEPVEAGLAAYSLFQKRLDRSAPWQNIHVIRSVVMGPFHVAARTRSKGTDDPEPILDKYVNYLRSVIQDVASDLHVSRARKAADTWQRDLKCMVMDDDVSVTKHLRETLAVLNHRRILDTWQHSETESDALKIIRDRATPLDLVFLDIDMSGSSEHPKGHRESGYTAYQACLERNRDLGAERFRIQAVFFFTKGRLDHEVRLSEIRKGFPGVDLPTFSLDKDTTGQNGSELERRNAVELVIRQISHLQVLRHEE